MGIIKAIVLGIVQGLTEFLPVSSSGHLVLTQKILGIDEPALLFDTMLHLGTLVAVFIVLWKDIWALLKRPFQRLAWLVVAATVPTVIIALLFKDAIEAAFSSGSSLGWGFLITAAALLVSEKLAASAGKGRDEAGMGWLDAIMIGALQGAAIFPAVSRSGLTISGALVRKLDRSFAAKFSFLLSIPAILGAVVLQGKDLFDGSASTGTVTVPMIAGTVVAAAVGVVAVKFMMKIIRQGTLRGFAIYVAVVGILVLLDQNVFRVFF